MNRFYFRKDRGVKREYTVEGKAEEVAKAGRGKEVISSSVQGISFLKTAFSQTKALSSGKITLQ